MPVAVHACNYCYVVPLAVRAANATAMPNGEKWLQFRGKGYVGLHVAVAHLLLLVVRSAGKLPALLFEFLARACRPT